MKKVLVSLAAVVLLAAGCSSSGGSDGGNPVPGPGQPSLQVGTPDLAAAKAAAGIEPCVPGPGAPGSSALPEVTVSCLGGGPSVDLSTLKGPLVLNFWFAGCAPCRTEMPALAQFHDQYGDQVPVIGIDSLDQYPGSAIREAAERGATYPQLADPGGDLGSEVAFANSNKGRPYTAFVDADGKVRFEKIGGFKTFDELVGQVDDSLGLDLAGAGS